MPLEPRDKELAAVGASIGANCRPCIEHHIRAGRAAGLSERELEDAVGLAEGVRSQAIALFSACVAGMLGGPGRSPDPASVASAGRDGELVALGASVGANSHALLRLHVGAAVEAGLAPLQIRSALKMASYVQVHAAQLTTEAWSRAYAELAESDTPAAAPI